MIIKLSCDLDNIDLNKLNRYIEIHINQGLTEKNRKFRRR